MLIRDPNPKPASPEHRLSLSTGSSSTPSAKRQIFTR
jgi:hypothetical protein